MENLTDRQKKIISLLKDHEIHTGNQLCEDLKVSLRTLQSDISQINKVYDIITSSNRGYSLNVSTSSFPMEISFDQNMSHVILKKLIFASRPLGLDALAGEMFISVSTLLRHLDNYAELLSQYHIAIKRKNHMLYIEGNEFNKRCFINHLINSEAKPLSLEMDNLGNYFPNIDINELKNVILKAIQHNGCFIDETYFSNMFLNMVIAFYRMKLGAYIEKSTDILLDEYSVDYKIAKEICDFYIHRWRIAPKKTDISYIATMLHGQIKVSLDNPKRTQNEIISESFIATIDKILLETFSYYMFNINYKEQLYSFALHVDALIKRAKYQQTVKNDLLESIQLNSPFIYDVAVHTTKNYQKHLKSIFHNRK